MSDKLAWVDEELQALHAGSQQLGFHPRRHAGGLVLHEVREHALDVLAPLLHGRRSELVGGPGLQGAEALHGLLAGDLPLGVQQQREDVQLEAAGASIARQGLHRVEVHLRAVVDEGRPLLLQLKLTPSRC